MPQITAPTAPSVAVSVYRSGTPVMIAAEAATIDTRSAVEANSLAW